MHNGRSLLFSVCKEGGGRYVKLLAGKVDVNQVNRHQETPLMMACKNSNKKIVQTLLEKLVSC